MRIEKLQKKLTCPAYIVEEPTNLYYLTGLDLSLGVLVVTPTTAELYVDGRYREIAEAKSPVSVRSIDENPFKNLKEVGFNSESTTYKRYTELKERQLNLIPLPDLVAELRILKEPQEQALLREASDLGIMGYEYALSILEEGITELEVAIELDIFWKRQGGQGVAFDPIIAFGSASSMPHYRAGSRMLKKGDIVLMDLGVTLNHYHSDMTRVHFFGDPQQKLKEIHSIVHEALQRALKLCKPGAKLGDIDQAARGYIESCGYTLPHSLGHGIGLEVHEAPLLRNKSPWKDVTLEAGMVITVEPGIYIPNLGGVRLEDTIIINSKGYENLTGLSLEY